MGKGFEIGSHSELVGALSVAARIEHAVLLEYLFAAFSCRRTIGEPSVIGMTSLTAARTLYSIAHDEMRHLGTIQNLLAALGAPPVADSFELPTSAGDEVPVSVQLTRLNSETIARFIATEAPPPVAPFLKAIKPPSHYKSDYLGDLYRGIAEGIRTLGDDAFLGLKVTGNSPVNWGGGFTYPKEIGPAEAAIAALMTVIMEGEGQGELADPQKTPSSHWTRFQEIARILNDLGPGADRVAWPCIDNPGTRAAAGRQLITHPLSQQIAVLGNHAYRLLWLCLAGVYSFPYADGDPEQVKSDRMARLAAFQEAARGTMATVLRPLGEELARMPAFAGMEEVGAPTAGLCFEQYEPIRIITQPDAAMISVVDEAARLIGLFKEIKGANRRVDDVAESLQWILKRFKGEHGRPNTPWHEKPGSGRFMTLSFSGWYSVRLATGGDPFDDTRGASGWQFAYAGEPDLNRTINLQHEGNCYVRPHVHEKVSIGVKVDAAEWDGKILAALSGLPVRLLGNPVFEGRNSVLASDGDEPIVPLDLSIRDDVGQVFLRRGHADVYEAPYSELFPLARDPFGPLPAAEELRKRYGVTSEGADGLKKLLDEMAAPLVAAAAKAEKGSVEEAVLQARLKAFSRPTWPWGVAMVWRLELKSSSHQFQIPGVAQPGPGSWWLELCSTCYHPDAQAALLSGVVHIPIDGPSGGPPEWKIKLDRDQPRTRPNMNVG